MAFMGLMIGTVFLVILLVIIFLMLTSLILALVLKKAGRKKDNKKMRIAGNIFLVLGIIFSVPVIAVIVYFGSHALFTSVTLPDGETKRMLKRRISVMDSYVDNPDEKSIRALEKLLDKHNDLIYYYDNNHESVLEGGLEKGNADVVRIALEHGAVFDNPVRYEHQAYEINSMDYYLGICTWRSITDGDVEILKMMFENNVSTELGHGTGYYTNAFGKAVWAVLYNDEYVTDAELAFIQLFVDNGLSSDPGLLLIEEAPVYCSFGPDYHADVARDSNYNQLMDIIGK